MGVEAENAPEGKVTAAESGTDQQELAPHEKLAAALMDPAWEVQQREGMAAGVAAKHEARAHVRSNPNLHRPRR